MTEPAITVAIICHHPKVVGTIQGIMVDTAIECDDEGCKVEVLSYPENQTLVKLTMTGPFLSIIGIYSSCPDVLLHCFEQLIEIRTVDDISSYYTVECVKIYGVGDDPICSTDWRRT